jgi:endonuclease/exonuclease/phosphatase family metal-dependent hydrolase
MSYNIQSGAENLERTADAIRREHADLVALQEVDVHWAERSGFADQARELAARLDMDVRFAPIYHIASPESGRPAREFGVALLSRLPITSWRNDTLTRLSTQEPNATPAPMPGFLEATIDVRGRPLKVFTTHLDYRADPSVRRSQVADMLRYIDASVPTILAGDLNATPDAAELAPLRRVLRDVWPSTAGAGLTYPTDDPVKRIDYMLVSSHLRVRSASVPRTQASDHRPVVVDLLLDPR